MTSDLSSLNFRKFWDVQCFISLRQTKRLSRLLQLLDQRETYNCVIRITVVGHAMVLNDLAIIWPRESICIENTSGSRMDPLRNPMIKLSNKGTGIFYNNRKGSIGEV